MKSYRLRANIRRLSRPSLLGASALAIAAAGLPAWAQEADDAAAQKDVLGGMEEIVVLGTPGGGGVRKRDASFAITTMPADELTLASPKSTAEIFNLVPGVWAESSGGVAGANIDVRGLPGGGDAPFVTMSINGAPIYGTEMLSFFEQSSIFRYDETVGSAEALRGGPNAVFSKGEPGVTLNFRLKEGQEDTEGRVKYTTSDYNLHRLDAVLSGKLADGLYYMVGGYARSSPGVRDAQFNSEKGYQFTAHLTKDLERGKIGVWVRATDDHGQWYLPMALNSGNDLGAFSQLGNATRLRTLQISAAGDTETYDFANGRGWKGVVSGLNADFDLGNGFSVRDNMSYTKGSADTFGLVPDGGAVRVSSLPGGAATTLGGVALSGGDYVQNYGHWVVMKDLESFTNDLSIDKAIGDHNITVGYYAAAWSSDDFWSIGHATPMQNIANGDFLDASTSCADVAAAGAGSSCFVFGLQSGGSATTHALYGADSWQATTDLRFDFGIRKEWIDIDYTLDSGPGYPDGTRDLATSHSDSEVAYTLAVNYDFNEDLGAFARYSDGFLFPHFDDVRENNLNVNGIQQWEAGVKYSSDWLSLFLTGFYNKNNNFSSVVGSNVAAAAFKTRAYGLEADSRLTFGDFNLAVIGTWQDAEITDSTTTADIGNQVLRQPPWQIRIAPSYNLYFGDYVATLYGAMRVVDDRYGDNANTVLLKSFTKIDAGVSLTTPMGLFFQVHADNLGDSHGITEGDPRNPVAPNGRPILGRSVKFSIGYDF